jgi:replicative DNA helicase
MAKRVEDALNGVRVIGIETGYPLYDKAIGGGARPGTIHVIAARPGTGKSFMAINMIVNIAKRGIPVLYLDTELEKDQQQTRLCSVYTGIALDDMEAGTFCDTNATEVIYVKSLDGLKSLPLQYVIIKGFSLTEQMSVIRRWFAKVVGKNKEGKYNPAVVILDYLKLMNAGDRGYDMKEWEVLGLRMTMLHDLMGQYNNPMIAFAQLNQEHRLAASDRIMWLADSVAYLADKSDQELRRIEEEQDPTIIVEEAAASANNSFARFPNMKLQVVKTRYGAAHHGGRFIGLYSDTKDQSMEGKACGRMEEIKEETMYDS